MNARHIVNKYKIEEGLKSAILSLQAAQDLFKDGLSTRPRLLVEIAIRKASEVENLLIEYGADND